MRPILHYLLFLSFILCLSSCQKEAASFISKNLNAPTVNAGTSQTIQQPAQNFTLTGSATSTNGPIAGYLWSLVSGPNVPVIQSPGQASTLVTNFVTGKYLFQLMAIDSAGLTGLDTVSVTLTQSPVKTLTLQPDSNITELNFAIINGANASVQDKDIPAVAWTSGGNPLITRGAFQFDLSTIPANATIISAKLTLYSIPIPIDGDQINANSGSDNSMYIRRINSAWSAASTWQTQPGVDMTDQVLIPHTNLPFLDLVDVDVKNMVGKMKVSGNYGFMLNLKNEVIYTARQFSSSRYPDATKHPKLVVVYQ
ncbi:MAG: DNRLRE domain-containing protein [Ferruginibacter sp.]